MPSRGSPRVDGCSPWKLTLPGHNFFCVSRNKVTTNALRNWESGTSKGTVPRLSCNWILRRWNCVVRRCELVFVYSHERKQKYKPICTKSARHRSLGLDLVFLAAATTSRRGAGFWQEVGGPERNRCGAGGWGGDQGCRRRSHMIFGDRDVHPIGGPWQ